MKWEEILNQKFRVYEIEEVIYIQSSQKSNGPDMFAKYICDAINPGDVPEALRLLYWEAMYGDNTKVKQRIRGCIYLIGRHVR